MRRFVRRRATLAAIAVAVLAAAFSAAGAGAQPATSSARKANTITIGIAGIPPFWYGLRTYLAADPGFGFYRRAGVEVVIKPFATGADAVRAVVAGQIDASWSDTSLGMTLISKGTALVGVEGMDKEDYVLSTRDPQIRTCADVKGHTIVVEAIGSSRYRSLQSMLKACKLTVNDVKVVAMATGQLQAALSGQVDAGVFHLNDLAQANDLGTPLRILMSTERANPNLHYDMLWTMRHTLNQKRADFVKVIKGDILASRYMYNPKNFERVAKFASVTGANPNVARFALREFLDLQYWPLNKSGLGIAGIVHTVAENVRFGNITPPSAAPTYKEVVDNSLWKEAWKQYAPKKKPAKKKK